MAEQGRQQEKREGDGEGEETEVESLERLYDISSSRGYLPKSDPFTSVDAVNALIDVPRYGGDLHHPLQNIFGNCDRLAQNVPKYLLTGTYRSVIDQLPSNAFDGIIVILSDEESLANPKLEQVFRFLMCQFSFLSHAYMWGSSTPAVKLPSILSVPFVLCAHAVKRPPILSYASYCLDNWNRVNKGDPSISLENVALLHNFLGGVDEHWFVTIHVAIEAAAGPALVAAGLLAKRSLELHGSGDASSEKEEEETKNTIMSDVLKHLTTIADSIEKMDEIFARMPEKCDPYIYYHRVRPYIFGTKNNPDLPNGLIYEGEFNNVPQFFRGETGAQSSILPALDGVLGVEHENDHLKQYLNEMRTYMPPKHVQFISFVETTSRVRQIMCQQQQQRVTTTTTDRTSEYDRLLSLARTQYNRALDGLEKFRSRHLGYAASYIQQQCQHHHQRKQGTVTASAVATGTASASSVANATAAPAPLPVVSASSTTAAVVGSGGSTEWGTGGTPFMSYLRKHMIETGGHKLKETADDTVGAEKQE